MAECFLGAYVAAQRFTIPQFLHSVQAAPDAFFPAVAICKEGNGYTAIHTGVYVALLEDRLYIDVHNLRRAIRFTGGSKHPVPLALFPEWHPVTGPGTVAVMDTDCRLRRSDASPHLRHAGVNSGVHRSVNGSLGGNVAFGHQDSHGIFGLLPGLLRARLKQVTVREPNLSNGNCVCGCSHNCYLQNIID